MTAKTLSAFIIAVLLTPLITRGATVSDDSTYQSPPVVVRIAASAAINAALTETFKASIHELRPDRSDNHSWPSRHTSWAFTGAAVIGHELYRRSPWWAVGAHAAADAVAMQRLLARQHYPKDVIGGAAIGLVSTEIGYALCRLLYPKAKERPTAVTADWLPALDVTTEMILPVTRPMKGCTAGIGAATTVRLSLPFGESWGVAVAGTMRSIPVKQDGVYADMLNSAGASAGIAGWIPFHSPRWSGSAYVMPGVARNFDGDGISHPSCSFTLNVTGNMACTITDRFALGCELGYLYWALRRGVSAMTLSVFTRAMF